MKRTMLGMLLLLALSAGSWWGFTDSVDAVLVEPQAPTVETATIRAAAEANATAPPVQAPELSRDAVATSAPSWRLVGRVRDADGTPVDNASVEVRLQFGHEREPLAEARTGADGRYSVDLEALRVLPPIDLRGARLVHSIHAPGRRAGGQVRLPHRDPAQSLVAVGDARLAAAAIVSGRVVDGDGSPVEAASVWLRPKASGASVEGEPAMTDASGRYVAWVRYWADVLVTAQHTAVGRAQTECSLSPADSDRTLPDLRLLASSTLRARVVFADGEPAAQVDMTIHEPGSSRPVAWATTDDDGRLVVCTLPPGRYDVRLSWSEPDAYPATTVATDANLPTIVLGDVHVLRLSFRDEAGRSLHTVEAAIDLWPASNHAAAAFAGGAPLAAGFEIDRSSCFGRFRSLAVPRGTWVRVAANQHGARAEVMVQAMPPRNVLETLLTLRDPAGDARLRLQLTTAGSDVGDVKVRLHQLHLGELGSDDLEQERDGTSRSVRWFPGRYRLEVAPKQAGMDFGWFAPFERQVQLRRGETTTVNAPVHLGGRLRFHLHILEPRAGGDVVDFAVETPTASGPAGQSRGEFIETTSRGWRLTRSPSAGVPLLWPPVLPPGHHVLAIRSRDYADTSVAALVTARTVTDVHVWLQPR